MSKWFRVPSPRPQASLHLYAFHHAGGSAAAYVKWIQQVPAHCELRLMELPGRGARHGEPKIEVMDEMIEAMMKSLPDSIDRPSIFFGHSLGALCAFEAAIHLPEASRAELCGIGLSSFVAPTLANRVHSASLSTLAPDDFIEAIERFSPLPKELRQNQMALEYYLGLIRSDFRLAESHRGRSEQQSQIPAILFAGADDQTHPAELLESWRGYVDVQSAVQILPGGHFHALEQGAAVIGQLLQRFSP